MTEDTYYAVYAVVQCGLAVLGIGGSREAAIADAKNWVNNPQDLEKTLVSEQDAYIGDMYVATVPRGVLLYGS